MKNSNFRWPPILMYHAIAPVEENPTGLSVSQRRFEAQMRYLKRRGLRGVSVRELLRAAGTERAKELVGITFDDGYENFLYAAVPVLERYDFSATVFAVGGMLGAENAWMERPRMKLLGATGLRETAKRGMEVGSHGMSHIRLSDLPTARLEEEVTESRHVLGEVLDGPVEGWELGRCRHSGRTPSWLFLRLRYLVYASRKQYLRFAPPPRMGDRWAGDAHHETQPLPVVLRGCQPSDAEYGGGGGKAGTQRDETR
jgi:peptidoglycan/xylan/chitin deacetylase (PgdA/CDA1 family)